ncbi:MAG: lysophospholipid acyltransferase family protein [Dermatophilaceae bacterium]
MARPRQKRPPAFLFAVALLRPLLMLLTRRRWSGAEHLVIDGGSVVVANHTSYADPLVVAHYLNDNGIHPNFLGKVEVFQVPVIGALLKAAGQIPVYRDTGQAADAYRAAVAAVNEGRCVTIYPEATLTRDPDLWPMRGKTGAARIALQTRCPVIPVAQWGAEQIIGPYSSRLDLLPRKEVIVRAGPPVDLSDLHERGISRDVLAEATDRIMAAITALLEDLRGEQAPAERFDPRAAGLPGTGNPGTGTSQKGTS